MRCGRGWSACVAVATVLALLVPQAAASPRAATPGAFNVAWTTPTQEPGHSEDGQATYQGGMPIGNGDTVAYVWPNVSAGAVQAYIAKADAMSTYTELFKLGMLQVVVAPNPFLPPAQGADERGDPTAGSDVFFNQSLDVATGAVTILAGGSSVRDYAVRIVAWVDANSNTVAFNVSSGNGGTPLNLTVTLASTRPSTAYTYSIPFGPCTDASSQPDVFVNPLPSAFRADTVVVYHRNDVASEGNYINTTLTQQGLGDLVAVTPDWWTDRQFGMAVDGGVGPQLSRTSPATLASTEPSTFFQVRLTPLSEQTATSEDWLTLLAQSVRPSAGGGASWNAHVAWWSSFWNRSYIVVNASQWNEPRADALPSDAVLWLQADTLDLADGAPVALWPDTSSYGNNATQSNVTAQPVFLAQGFNGYPTVRFDGVATFLQGLANVSAQSTIIAAFRDEGSTAPCCSGVFFTQPGHNGLSTHPAPTSTDDDDGTSAGDSIVIMIDWAGSDDGGVQNIYNKTVVGTVMYSADASTSYVDGCLQSTQPAYGAAGTSFMVGSRNDELQRFFNGDISEVIVYPRALSAAEQAAVEQYLISKWGMTSIHCRVPPNDAFAISQQYAITRYVQTIQSRTMWPIKFNGMMFVANMNVSAADYRQWGPSNWWQNTRLPYWSMLHTGDFDIFETILKYYENMLPFATQRTIEYFNHTGIFFTETKTIFGAYDSSDYGCSRPEGYPIWLEDNDYIHLDYGGDGGGPEIALMVLDAFLYTSNTTLLKRYLPIATLTVDFFRQHYKNRTSDGKYVFWPTQALETYWCAGWDTVNNQPPANCCVDDMPTLSGIYSLLQKLLQLPSNITTPAQREEWSTFLGQLPPLPITPDGSQLAVAGVISSGIHNDETPELYATHPYRLFTVGTQLTAGANLSLAINAWLADSNAQSNSGWNQGVMNAALLGMADEAAAMVIERAETAPAPGYRFQGFMPHMQDYEPSADHLANLNSAVNWMLLQSGDDGYGNTTIVVFPAWPCNWDVAFKLWAPGNTTVELDYVNGTLASLNVVPASRRSSLVFANCVTGL